MAKTTVCIIARAVSTRLPLKAFRLVDKNTSMLDYIIQRVKMCKKVDHIYLCTSHEPVDDIMEDVAWKNGIDIYRGSPDAVIERMMAVGEKTKSDYVIRITGDNVFTSYEFIDEQIDFATNENLDYVRLVGVPIGATAEVMKFEALTKCYHSMDPSVSEYLMLFMFDPTAYRCGIIRPFPKDYAYYSLTVDYPNDFTRTKKILEQVSEKEFLNLKLERILDIISKHDVPYSTIEPQSTLRLPYGKEVTYAEFSKDMDVRASKSQQR